MVRYEPLQCLRVILKRRYGPWQPVKAAWEEMGLQEALHGDCGSLQGICESLEELG